MAEEEKPAEESAQAKSPARSRLPLVAGGVAALLLLGGGGTFLVLRKGDAPAAKSEKAAEHARGEEEHAEKPAAEHASEHGAEHAEESAAEHGEAAEPEHGEEAAEEGHGEGGEHGAEASAGGEHGGAPAPKFVSIDSFVVNISDGDRDRFLKVKLDLEVSNAEVGKEIDARLPQVKDILIGLLSSQSAASVRTLEGKDQLREQVLTRLNAVVRSGVVRSVLFTEFVVQ